MTVETLAGEAMRPHLGALHALRCAVFRDWPYLYDGDPAQESRHLAGFARKPRAALVLARAGGEAVGAATCLPLAEESEAVRAGFAPSGLDPADFFYFGESVLRREWRGRGIGVAFFAAREAHARAVSDCRHACFCSVRRDPADPRRPVGDHGNAAFWRNRGYAPLPGVSCTMRWREVGAAAETDHELDFWARALR